MIAIDQTMFPVCVNDLMKSLVVPPEFYTPYPSIAEVQAFQDTTFAFDIETPKYREMGDKAPVEMVGLSAKKFGCICVPVRGPYIPELRRIFRNAKQIIGHNSISFDMPRLKRDLDIKLAEDCIHWDTMLLHHLLFPDFPHDLEFVGTQVTEKGNWKADKGSLEIYNCRDTDVTFQVWQTLLPMLRRQQLESLYLNVQVPLALICTLLHDTGFKLDPSRLKEVRVKLLEEVKREETFIPSELRTRDVPTQKRVPAPQGTLGKSGKPVKFILEPSSKVVIPWRSTTNKLKYFYGPCLEGGLALEEVLDPKKETVTTGKLAITKLTARLRREGREADARAVQAIGRLNKIDELITTFASEDMGKVVRLHPHFNVHGTSSGRLSSSDPNLQNIPESTRFLYIPSHPGWDIIDVDFSNIENRLTAHLAGDTFRLDRYNDPKHSDYKLLVNRAFGIPYEEVVKDNDREAPYGKCKAIVLGMNYGLGERKIANMYDMDPKEVRHLVSTWRDEMKLTSLWQQRTTHAATAEGVLTTPFGRKRWFWTSSAYTESLSFLPQSTAADIIFRAMIGLMYERIEWPEDRVAQVVKVYKPLPYPARLILQVHDSLVLECPHDLLDDVVKTLKLVMEQPWPELNGMSIPVSVGVGPSWGECKPYQL
jgi:DNA polymerase I-like protein with 3'-5' exonuclease and polymerase domains